MDGTLHVGAASTSIVPDGSVLVAGQLYMRVSEGVATPLLASAIALETRDGDTSLDQAIMISCDLVKIGEEVVAPTRALLAQRLPEVDPGKLVVNATHTHTAPQVYEPSAGTGNADITPAEYRAFLAERLAEVAVQAWRNRRPGSVGWGLGHAVVGVNRRPVYADGRSVMYGKVDVEDFRGIEGYEDHGIEVLCFWDGDGQLIATAVNVACPAQEAEHDHDLNADFWHEVRTELQREFGENLCVLGWVAAAGDQSPHLVLRKAAEERMRGLRGLTRLQELGRRVVQGWREAYEGAEQERHATVPLAHRVWTADLPVRLVTEEERDAALAAAAELEKDPKGGVRAAWQRRVADRFETQKTKTTYPTEVHVLRLGDVAIATNQFELFTDFGMQMKGRSPALQTFVIQLAVGGGTYLPTERAVRGGGYSAIINSNQVGPEGGQQLVEETLAAINDLWPS
jgi:hypothetical protein